MQKFLPKDPFKSVVKLSRYLKITGLFSILIGIIIYGAVFQIFGRSEAIYIIPPFLIPFDNACISAKFLFDETFFYPVLGFPIGLILIGIELIFICLLSLIWAKGLLKRKVWVFYSLMFFLSITLFLPGIFIIENLEYLDFAAMIIIIKSAISGYFLYLLIKARKIFI